ncbi:Steroid 5-alpha reductase family enzyme [Desulfacinum infernum DSM 9756]|uniref:Steroid 5-alpha reductase family enzyme n=1 Tax=Desulfacinum infernum DSM 9756 TaxID=1121391 RepID=A0A1M5FUH9_9BACT|nr:DUF1295 domain-containing protein [Desulfacinum infernum]SHF95195.1 Steroid 5-alpha reductase family enzyme [Desulfacinum infernum DSM 9756]
MTSTGTLFAINLAAALLLMTALWPYTVWKKKASLVDRFWGLGFVLVAWISFWAGQGYGARRLLVTTLTTLWGLRLSAHITGRSWGKEEDPRYAAMRKAHGERFAVRSLWSVFLLQGVLLWIVSLPVQWACTSAEPARITALDLVGAALSLAGIVLESTADFQLLRFLRRPENRGKIMDRGLWAYSRHPNYFGETLVWWGMYLVTLSTPRGGWTVVGPALITFLLLRVSGVTLLESVMKEKSPEYQEYVERTSAFVPWFPRKRRKNGPGGA